MLKSIPLPTIEIISTFDPSAAAFVAHLRDETPAGIWSADGLWEEYADYIAMKAPRCECDNHLTRAQLFRQMRGTGIQRFRSGAKDARGKRPYLYRLATPKRPRRRPRRIDDVRPWSVVV
ncbi:MAG: hypothetical protein AB7S74_01860 [Hyphomicrobium sp.]